MTSVGWFCHNFFCARCFSLGSQGAWLWVDFKRSYGFPSWSNPVCLVPWVEMDPDVTQDPTHQSLVGGRGVQTGRGEGNGERGWTECNKMPKCLARTGSD